MLDCAPGSTASKPGAANVLPDQRWFGAIVQLQQSGRGDGTGGTGIGLTKDEITGMILAICWKWATGGMASSGVVGAIGGLRRNEANLHFTLYIPIVAENPCSHKHEVIAILSFNDHKTIKCYYLHCKKYQCQTGLQVIVSTQFKKRTSSITNDYYSEESQYEPRYHTSCPR